MKAVVFPGQGSQKVGMGEELFDRYSELTASASACLGDDIKALCLEDPKGVLNQTQFTQPALYAVSAMAYLARKDEGADDPVVFAGHSLGEYVALFAAGIIDFETGMKLVVERGKLMAQASEGGMAAVIGMSADAIDTLLTENASLGIDVANFNEPLQTVISGPKAAIVEAKSLFESAGARRYIPLNVSAAFHSRYMQAASTSFQEFLSSVTFKEPEIPVIANVTAAPYPGVSAVPDLLAQQISSSVQWVKSVDAMLDMGVSEFEEVGPGNVLTGLIRKIQKHRTAV